MRLLTTASFLIYVVAGAASSQTTSQAPTDIQPTHPNGEVTIVIDYEVRPGFEEDFEQHFTLLVECARLDPGNVMFDVGKVVGMERRYVSYAIWHLSRPYAVALFEMFERALERPITEGGRRFLTELSPATRLPPVSGDPADRAECR
jgi:quinol monooxygenase YgiN